MYIVHISYCVGIYSDVIDKVDKEPPFDLHAYLAPPPVPTAATANAEISSTKATTIVSNNTSSSNTPTTTNTAISTATLATTTAIDKPKKEPSKPKLYVMISLYVFVYILHHVQDKLHYSTIH